MDIDSFLIEETENQGYDLSTKDGLIALIRYTRAWDIGKNVIIPKTATVIEHADSIWITICYAGKLLDPRNNFFRQIPVSIGSEVIPFEGISNRLDQLIRNYFDSQNEMMEKYKLSPEEFYYHFEKIHPFYDGNGRVGKLIYNILRGSWKNPVQPEEFDKLEKRIKYSSKRKIDSLSEMLRWENWENPDEI